MLLPENIHPANTLYFNGAIILRAMRNLRAADLIDLYIETRKYRLIPMALFVLSLDWLFLADFINIDERGFFILCS